MRGTELFTKGKNKLSLVVAGAVILGFTSLGIAAPALADDTISPTDQTSATQPTDPSAGSQQQSEASNPQASAPAPKPAATSDSTTTAPAATSQKTAQTPQPKSTEATPATKTNGGNNRGDHSPKCVQNPKFSYTFDGAIGSGTVTVTGGKQGDKLCDALAIRAAGWDYDLPASGNPSWPQTLHGYNDTAVNSIGTFSYKAPQIEACRQYDIYAQFESKGGFSKLALPAKLTGPGKPYEPPFLHQTLSGKGPNPTYSTTSSEGCNPPAKDAFGTVSVTPATCTAPATLVYGAYENATVSGTPDGTAGPGTYDVTFTAKAGHTNADSQSTWNYNGELPGAIPTQYTNPDAPCYTAPTEVTGTGTFTTATCTRDSGNWAHVDAVEDGIWTFTDKNGATLTTGVGEGYEGGIPDGLSYGPITVTLSDAGTNDTVKVIPQSYTWNTVDSTTLECVLKDAKAWVELTAQPTCTKPGEVRFWVENATWSDAITPGDQPNSWVRQAIADEGHTFADGSTTLNVEYTIPPALGYQSTDSSADCYKAPPTPGTTPSNPTPSNGDLAETGLNGEIIKYGSIAGIVSLFAGIVLFALRRRAA